MEGLNQKSLERVISQRAFQMGSSFPCQICVMGFLCGVCVASLFMAALFNSFAGLQLRGVSFSPGISTSPHLIGMVTDRHGNYKSMETGRMIYSQKNMNLGDDERLFSSWRGLLHQVNKSRVPKAPHLENCKSSEEINRRLDGRNGNTSFPPWTLWKGKLNNLLRHQTTSEGAYPPWITGSDEENYPLTRKVQADIWLRQHPMNCRDPNVRFLVADWERIPGFGIGAQLAGMCGLLAIAINEKRVLVTNYYNRADHDGCKDSLRGSWSCYFFSETSPECRERAFELTKNKEAWERGIISGKDNYRSKEIWAGRTPRIWGEPWNYLQPTTYVNGSLIANHRKMDRRWWRAQAVRYLMRFKTEYTCNLMNIERHEAFGREAARMVLATPTQDESPREGFNGKFGYEIENFVWSNYKPWIPRPLLSMHVRMGDKACEMKVSEFQEYMRLAERIRNRFPYLNNIWLSTEMQEVIDKSKLYPHWKFHYTNVPRQVGNTTMASYEESLGRERSTNYPLVNFLLATEADFFVGALGSTWCFLIDGMRNTGGKVMAGYLSVNKDRFW